LASTLATDTTPWYYGPLKQAIAYPNPVADSLADT